MALTRKQLSAYGIEPDKIDQIIEGHSETVNALQDEIDKAKAEADKYKAEASKVAGLQKELETAKKEAETAKNHGAEYDKLKTEYENYKAEVAKKEADAVKTEKFRDLLKDVGLSEKGIQMVLKWQGVEDVQVDDDGKIANAKELKKAVKEDWGEYIIETRHEGAPETNPPSSQGGTKMTRDEIMKIKDRNERQKAIMENPEAFGYGGE